MGLDRFANFISKSTNNDCIEEININNNVRPIISNHIIFDLNFLIYQEIIEVENEVNDIIKILLCLPWANNTDSIENYINYIFNQSHWKLYYENNNFENILDGNNEDEIINNFLFFITSKIPNNTTYNLSIIEFIIFEKIYDTIIKYINKFHIINNDDLSFIQSIAVFFDGIPSFSKIVEQRRRRLKNYLESIEKKKIFKLYFDNLLPNNKKLCDNLSKKYIETIDNNLYFDYFKWIKKRFSIDKSFGPSCEFIKNLDEFINNKIKNKFTNINIYINSASENGEADLKIFKYIANKSSGDYCIHTTDSDLIHQILVQQTYYKIINKDINLTVIKYLKNYNLIGYAQILDANIIIKNMLDLYNNLIVQSKKSNNESSTKYDNLITNNYKIIWDLCLIFYLFGNDHLPSSLEIGPELGLEYFMITHYKALNNDTIININNNEIMFNINNFLLLLQQININKNENITKIILQRFFKINSQLIHLLVDKLKLNFNDILLYFKYFIYNQSLKINIDELDNDDLRKIIHLEDNNYDNLNEDIKKQILDNEKLIADNIDYYDSRFMGLILYSKPINISQQDDKELYQDLYMFIIDKINNEQCQKFPKLYDHIDVNYHLKQLNENNNYDSYQYLKKIYHLVTTQFGSMNNYYTNNLTFYKYYSVPSIDKLIEFINSSHNIINKWDIEIKEDNVTNYFNSINHHIIISPFLSLNKESDTYLYYLSDVIKNIITNNSNTKQIDNLWLTSDDINSFDYRDIDIKDFLLNWNNYI